MIPAHLKSMLAALVFTLAGALSAFAAETHLLKSRVSGIDGRPMVGAKLFLYDSPNVRRPADFISSLSDRAGMLQLVLPLGKYWVVARYKADGKYGPLMPGDRHSGEPLEVDMTAGGAEADFVVADIRELGQRKRAGATDALRLKGRVLDTRGAPVAQAYVIAHRSKEFGELPDFISAWTGDDGAYEVYLPPGATYYVSASRQFPPVLSETTLKPVVIESGKIDIAIDINLTVQ
jgi:hypothetical protein